MERVTIMGAREMGGDLKGVPLFKFLFVELQLASLVRLS